MNAFDRYKRKGCPPIKDKRPKGLRSVPVIGYELMQAYARRIEEMKPIDTVLKELKEEKER